MAPADFQGTPESEQLGAPGPQDKINFVKEAFHLQYNWIAMVECGRVCTGEWQLSADYPGRRPRTDVSRHRSAKLALSAAGAILEIRRTSSKSSNSNLSEMLRSLPAEMQSRYIHAAQVCGSIRTNFAQFSSTSQIFLAADRRAPAGPAEWLRSALVGAAQQQQYLKSTEQDGIKHEIASLQKSLSSDPPKVQEINKKRIEILTKRLEKFDKISENRKVVDAQCSAVEDVLMLVRDQSVTMRDPQQVSERLDSLVQDVEQTEQTVQQVEAIFSEMSPDLDGLMSMDDTSSTSSSPNRVRMSN